MKRTQAEQQLRRVGVFTDTDEPLQEKLSRFERNIDSALVAHTAQKAERWTTKRVRAGEIFVQYWEAILYDAASGAGVVLLPRPKSDDAGKMVIVKNASNSATAWDVRAAPGSQVDLATSVTITGALNGAEFITDGSNWWSV